MIDSHEYYMQLAIKLADKGRYTTSPNPRVGCVLVRDSVIVGQGFHVKAGLGHAEVNAIKDAGDKASGATAYVTLEPCSHFGRTPPCAQGLIDAGVRQVVFGMQDPNPLVSGRGIKMLQQAGIDCIGPVLEHASQQLNPGFIKRMTQGLPLVRCKLAASLDGKTAMASGESQWITSPAARRDVQSYRAQSCAIISGADTVITDNARLNVRYQELSNVNGSNDSDLRQPVRVIIDTKHRLTPDLALFSIDAPIILIRTELETGHNWPHFVEQMQVKKANDFADLSDLMLKLAERGLNEIWLESGRRLAGAFFAANLVDELILYQAPKLLSDDAMGLLQIPGLNSLSAAINLNIKDIRKIGQDVRFICHIVKD
ncbi:bifunctional diaminohydroxyphosphoribosylaminopyrimidine deaminase/5-amino-6-(5-phosphoribosylamino)uracil reductase RibD [Thalassotalea sp. HSM 43]|uniref:bifunctional diaminohydroxyphosphoribosylaminopyrimidine deaminase/5-amino-6-(5-phosphoribosylamino)uracil reductase RibD n=1 Tax=Thalassotalea sp. HSM 43 TaxID=2552945 RepID=UPI0010802A5D|nr:bifunctional diaminohydroxyphosphoribosylaminopyrimidine deaminase/5-amino-6-(5-phosphoribosylamino)uracil reductase RibD [Thalassotalea sp. HSM 43]QBY05193.1 bifunctional diaminohydroxyphosphoribosylaminopyrimidine deaminase/5-amino-6-(5-phosphoribosylamino)uracil reductase RibD [Thalassotalea sp. HSM 43]